MKTGLVLEGGALRGLFTAGILDVLMENNVQTDGLIGVSAGAAFGCNYKSKQHGRVIRYNKRYAKDWRYCSWKSLLLTGDMFGKQFCYHDLPDKLDVFDSQTFDANPMEFYAVCTDVTTGRPIYKKLMQHTYECNEWIRASASMPLVSHVVEIRGIKLLDGGVADSIPLEFFQHIGYERNRVVLTQPDGYVKKRSSLLWLMKILLRKYPAFLRAMADRPAMYNRELAYVKQQERAGNTLVIRPQSKIKISHTSHDPTEMQRVYDEGRRIATENMPAIRKFLSR